MNVDIIRIICFVLFLLLFISCELLFPRRKLIQDRFIRWTGNISLIIISSLIIRLTLPIVPLGACIWAQNNEIGLFNTISLDYVVTFILGVLILDAIIYWQHRFFHKINFFWRFHRVHHSDCELDVSSGLRFHPIEILLSTVIKLCAGVLIGVSPMSMLIFEIILNMSSMFTHANLNLPKKIDKILKTVLVTPDMHRIHHSSLDREMKNNFGFNISIWDKLFKTYQDQPKSGHLKMEIGLRQFRDPKNNHMHNLITQPFINDNLHQENTKS